MTGSTSKNEVENKIALKRDVIENSVQPRYYKNTLFTLLDKVAESEIGKYLIENNSLNAYWTSKLINKPEAKEDFVNELEKWLYTECPTVKASQQRFKIFQKLAQEYINKKAPELENFSALSLPCGLMDDLLNLDYSALKDFNLHGIDIDPESIKLAKENAEKKKLLEKVKLSIEDAFTIKYENQFDLLMSNGLNIYIQDDIKHNKLFNRFYKALKPGGLLISSFLSPPPILSDESPWDLNAIGSENINLQYKLFAEILEAKWQVYKTEKEMQLMLRRYHFKAIKFFYDKNNIFPTLIAYK